MEQLSRIFFRGLVTLLPIALTIYIVYTAMVILENFLGGILRQILRDAYVPGLGFTITLVLIFSFGLLLNSFLTQKVLRYLERKLNAIPFVKAIYSPLRDLMNLFSKKDDNGMKSVVLFKAGESHSMMGLVTRDNFNDLHLGEVTDHKVAVYVPFSYALGGYTFLVEKSAIQHIDLPIEKAMSLAITGWVKTDTSDSKPEENKSAPSQKHP